MLLNTWRRLEHRVDICRPPRAHMRRSTGDHQNLETYCIFQWSYHVSIYISFGNTKSCYWQKICRTPCILTSTVQLLGTVTCTIGLYVSLRLLVSSCENEATVLMCLRYEQNMQVTSSTSARWEGSYFDNRTLQWTICLDQGVRISSRNNTCSCHAV